MFVYKTKKRSEFSFTSFLWGRVDSNHRTHPRTDLQSVAIATMRLPQSVIKTLALKRRCKDTIYFLCSNKKINFFKIFFYYLIINI